MINTGPDAAEKPLIRVDTEAFSISDEMSELKEMGYVMFNDLLMMLALQPDTLSMTELRLISTSMVKRVQNDA